MPYGLSGKTITEINAVFTRHPAVTKAVLFGSRAKGNFKEGSDIDLALYGRGLNLTVLNRIRLEMDDLSLPYRIDLAIYDELANAALKEHIDRIGVIFYQR